MLMSLRPILVKLHPRPSRELRPDDEDIPIPGRCPRAGVPEYSTLELE